MYKLQAVTIQNYRSFARPTKLELKPLTLLYGRNNAGKSALLSLLPMLSEAVSEDAQAPFPSRDPAGRRVHFRSDLVWKESATATISFTLHWKRGEESIRDYLKLEYYIDALDMAERLLIQELRIENEQGDIYLQALRTPPPVEDSVNGDSPLYWPYRVHGRDLGETWKPFRFAGLLIEDSMSISLLDEQRKRLKSLRGQVQWLGSVRGQIPELLDMSGENPRRLGPDGSGAAEVLFHREEIRRDVNPWYESAQIGRRLQFVPLRVPEYKLCLMPKARHWDIPIQQTGEGMSQVFPVLVAASMARYGQGVRVLAVEEPESHLHGDAQVALAGYLARIAADPDPPIILLETHSRLLLLGVQLAIARGELSPDRALAYWVDQQSDDSSEALPIRFSSQGKMDGWPVSVFRDEINLSRELWEIELANMSTP